MEKNNEKENPHQKHLKEVTLLFLKLGFTTFGGPASFIAMTHDEVVKRRKWLDEEKFLDLIGATNLIPGPNAVEMALNLGYLRAGWAGFFLGGICYTLPAMLIVTALAWYYQRFGSAPQVGWILYAVKPVVIAIIGKALWFLGKKALTNPLTQVVAIYVFTLYLLGFDTLFLLVAAGVLIMVIENAKNIKKPQLPLLGLFPAAISPLSVASHIKFNLLSLFFTFLKIGSVLYGSGYVLLAFLHSDLITRLGWLTEKQLIDAIAIGQITPGPLFTTATFVGFILGGIPGGLIATIGIFLPSYFLVALTTTYIPKMRESKWFCAFLNGVNAASFALMGAVTVQIARSAVIDPLSLGIALAALCLLVFTRINTTWFILAAIFYGILRFLLGT